MGIHETMTHEPPAAKPTDRPTLLIVEDDAGPRERDRGHLAHGVRGLDALGDGG